MAAQVVREIAAEAFTDAIDMLSIIETLDAGNTPALLPPSTRLAPMQSRCVSIALCGRVWW